MVLDTFIKANRGEILERARAKVSERQFPAVSTDELESGLPLFLTQLAETLRLKSTSEPFSPTAIGTSAGRHGIDLLEKGWTIAQVVHDYGDICQVITGLAVEKRLAIKADEFQTLNLCLDNAIAGAVTEFSRERDEQTFGDGEAERLGQLTHELRNLLSTAMLSYEALTSGRVAIGGSTGAILGRSLTGLRDLIDTTISEVRLSAGKHEAKRMSVTGFLHEVEGAASLQARQRELDLTFALPPIEVFVDADRQLLSSALLNLLQNAFKYTIPHGRVAVRTAAHDGKVFIEVEDECGGLPDKNAESFFSPFGERRGKNRSGLGLGLSISRKAVKTCGGDIHVRNLPGKGCIFTIELPSADREGKAEGAGDKVRGKAGATQGSVEDASVDP
jgi:signal transduction histidine kinase